MSNLLLRKGRGHLFDYKYMNYLTEKLSVDSIKDNTVHRSRLSTLMHWVS